MQEQEATLQEHIDTAPHPGCMCEYCQPSDTTVPERMGDPMTLEPQRQTLEQIARAKQRISQHAAGLAAGVGMPGTLAHQAMTSRGMSAPSPSPNEIMRLTPPTEDLSRLEQPSIVGILREQKDALDRKLMIVEEAIKALESSPEAAKTFDTINRALSMLGYK